MQSASNLAQRYKAASEYINAVNDLPPTYKAFEEVDLNNCCPQIFPDPATPDHVQRALNRVNAAEQKMSIYRVPFVLAAIDPTTLEIVVLEFHRLTEIYMQSSTACRQ
jgi:hypothetical protein